MLMSLNELYSGSFFESNFKDFVKKFLFVAKNVTKNNELDIVFFVLINFENCISHFIKNIFN